MKKGGYFLISAILAGVDLGVKEYVERHKEKFSVHHNKGFSKNRLDDRSEIVSAVSAGMTTAIALGIGMSEEKRGVDLEKIGWAIVLGGALSNTFDRLKRRFVVDYIPLGRYIYNLGDFFIYTGAIIAAAVNFFGKDD